MVANSLFTVIKAVEAIENKDLGTLLNNWDDVACTLPTVTAKPRGAGRGMFSNAALYQPTRANRRGKRPKPVANRHSHNELEKNRRAGLRNFMDALKEIVPLGPDCSKHTTLGVLTKGRQHVESLSEREHRLSEESAALRVLLEDAQSSLLERGVSARRVERILAGSLESLPSSPEPMDDDDDSSSATTRSSSSYSPSSELESQWGGGGVVSVSPPAPPVSSPRYDLMTAGGNCGSGNGKILQPYRGVGRQAANSSSLSSLSSGGTGRYNPIYNATRASASITIPGSNRGGARTLSPTSNSPEGFSRRPGLTECLSLPSNKPTLSLASKPALSLPNKPTLSVPAKPVHKKMAGMRFPTCRATSIPRFRVYEGR